MKILFILNSCLGDVILSTSVIKYIIDKYPQAELYIIKDYRSGGILNDFPNIKQIYNYKKLNYHFHWFLIIYNFIFRYYDIVYDFKNTLLSRILFVKERFIFQETKKSIINSNLSVNQIIKKTFNIPKHYNPYIYLNDISFQNNALLNFNTKYIVLAPTLIDKDLEEDYYLNIINHISNFKIIIIGTNMENSFYDKYKGKFDSNVKNLCNSTNLLETAYLIKNSTLFIGRDSGLYHICHSLNKKGIIFFLNENNKVPKIIPTNAP